MNDEIVQAAEGVSKKTPVKRRATASKRKVVESGRGGSRKMDIVVKIVVGLLIVASLSAAVFFYFQYRALKNDPGKIARDEVKMLVAELDAFIELPQGEEPTLATVTDSDKLREEAFFSNAQDGDKVLVYNSSQKAILYRPSVKKIIEVAPLRTGDSTAKQEQNTQDVNVASTSTEVIVDNEEGEGTIKDETDEVVEDDANVDDGVLSVAMYNGSETIGLTYRLEEDLAGVENIEVITRDKAKSTEYKQTLVIDISGEAQSVVEGIAEALNAKITELPEGEQRPDTDILIIGGGE